MSLGTLTESYYMKDDLLFDPPAVRRSPKVCDPLQLASFGEMVGFSVASDLRPLTPTFGQDSWYACRQTHGRQSRTFHG